MSEAHEMTLLEAWDALTVRRYGEAARPYVWNSFQDFWQCPWCRATTLEQEHKRHCPWLAVEQAAERESGRIAEIERKAAMLDLLEAGLANCEMGADGVMTYEATDAGMAAADAMAAKR